MVKIPLYNQGLGPAAGLATGSLGPQASTAGEQAVLAESQAIAKAFDVAGQFAQEERNAQVQAQLDDFNTRTFNEGRDISLNDTSTTTAEVEQKRQKFIEQKEREVANLSLTMSERKAFQQNLRREANNIFSKAGAAAFQRGQIFRSDATNNALQALIEKASQDPDMRDIHKAEFEEKVREGKLRGLTLEFDEDDFEYRLERRILLSEQEDAKLGTRYYEEKLKAIVSGEGPYKGMPVERLEALAGKTRAIIREKKAEAKIAAAAARADFLAKYSIEPEVKRQVIAQDEFDRLGGFEGVVRNYGKEIATILEVDRIAPNRAFSTAEDYDAPIADVRQYIESNPPMAAEYLPVLQELQNRKAAFQESMRTDPVGTFVDGYTQRYGSKPSRAYISQHLRNQGISASPYTAEEKEVFSNAWKEAKTVPKQLDILREYVFGSLDNPVPNKDRPTVNQDAKNVFGLTGLQQLAILQNDATIKNEMLVAAITDSKIVTAGLESAGLKRLDIRSQAVSELQEYTDGFEAAGATVMTAQMIDSVAELAAWRIATGRDSTKSAAVKNSVKVIESLFGVEKINGHQTIIPRIAQVKPEEVSNVLQRLIGEDVLYKNIDDNFYGEYERETKREAAIAHYKGRGRFVPFRGEDNQIVGYNLLAENGAVALNKDGSAIEVSLNDLVSMVRERRLTPENISESEANIMRTIKDLRSDIEQLEQQDPSERLLNLNESVLNFKRQELDRKLNELENIKKIQGQ